MASYSFDDQKKAFTRRDVKLKDVLEETIGGSSEGRPVISVDELSIRYLYRDPAKDVAQWKTEWKKEDGVFIAVRFISKSHNEEFNKTVFIPIAQ